jgi:hypothetical protein
MRMPRVVVELAVRGPRGGVSVRSAMSVRGRFRSLMHQDNAIDIMAWRGI